MIFIQLAYKVFLVFSPKEILLDTHIFSISTSFKKKGFYGGKIYFFQFQYPQMSKLFYPFLYVILNFYFL